MLQRKQNAWREFLYDSLPRCGCDRKQIDGLFHFLEKHGLAWSAHGEFSKMRFAAVHKGQFAKKYRIEKKLGEGAGGAAYLVNMVNPRGDQSAVYVAKQAHTEKQSEEMQEEFDWMAKLVHPNIANVVELIEGKRWDPDPDNPGFVEERWIISIYAPGSDLFKYACQIRAQAPMTEEWIAGTFRQAMQGVSYLHGQKVMHNDLKPDNILMMEAFSADQPDRVPKCVIADFGRARQGCVPVVGGDPRYQSPQKWLDDGTDDHIDKEMPDKDPHFDIRTPSDYSCDIWSMGVTLFELLSGGDIPFIYRPCELDYYGLKFEGEDGSAAQIEFETVRASVVGPEPVSLERCGDIISQQVSELIKSMLAKDARLRPKAAEVLDNDWFKMQGRHELPDAISMKFGLVELKGIAHSIFLEAITQELEGEQYDAAVKLFNKHDTDRDGSLNMLEFREACRESGLDEDKAALAFNAVDTDKSGSLDIKEFIVATFDWNQMHEKDKHKQLRRVFEKIDVDSDGEITENEVRDFFKGVLLEAQVRLTFKTINRSGSGRITFEELERFVFDSWTPEELQRYEAAVHAAPVQLFEQGLQPEAKLGAACCVGGICCLAKGPEMCGIGACIVGALAFAYRFSRTPEVQRFWKSTRGRAESAW